MDTPIPATRRVDYGYIVEQDVRDFVQDRTAADNGGLDLNFSSEDIKSAMKRAARDYNSLPPVFIQIDSPDRLPGNTNIFLDATAEQLYISEMGRLTRDDIEYSAGGVQTPLARKRIEHLKDLIKMHGDRWREAAKAHKISINLRRGYRHF